MFRRILVSTDGSPLSGHAAAAAIDLAALTHAELLVLKTVPRSVPSYYEGVAQEDYAMHDQIEQHSVEGARETVEAIRRSAQEKGVRARPLTPLTPDSDSIGETIVAVASRHDCQLIVMASHSRHGITSFLLGSETQYVLSHSRIPVLILR